ncbi:MAG: hypothetical protein ACLGHP_01150, partial [Vicinamibacteria bacterium]
MFAGYDELIARLDAAVGAGDADAITRQVKHDLEDLLGRAVTDFMSEPDGERATSALGQVGAGETSELRQP